MGKIYIISGIEPSKKGAGKFLSFFILRMKESNVPFYMKYLHTPENIIVKLFRNTLVFNTLKELYYKFFRKTIRILSTYNSDNNIVPVIFHPQSLGFKNVTELITNYKLVYIYVLDNFFFCKKSYNYIKGDFNACMLCLKNIDYSVKNKCIAFPNKYSHNEYVAFINLLYNNLHKLIFLTQNNQQSLLLKKKFGDLVQLRKIGMFTGEFSLKEKLKIPSKFKFDILYHNTLSYAKGLDYFIELCKIMPQYSFVIPFTKREIEKYTGKINCNNIYFIPCNWNNGLKNLIFDSKITIVPSLWSAPIEGALLKSLFYSNVVAIVSQEFSFSSELPSNICIHLTPNLKESSHLLKEVLKSNISLRDKAKEWLASQVSDNIKTIDKFIQENR